MPDIDSVTHDITLIITVALVIFLITGIGVSPASAGIPTVVPGE